MSAKDQNQTKGNWIENCWNCKYSV